MTALSRPTGRPASPPVPVFGLLLFAGGVYACAIYANLAMAVRNSADLRFFPPFKPHVNSNHNRDLAAENYNIARSIRAGQGFSSPFVATTGPTAWMPPILPAILAGLLWCSGDSRDTVVAVVVFLQVNTLLVTGLLVVRLVQQTAVRIGTGIALLIVLVEVLRDFTFWFQMTQDCWLVLLAVDLLVAAFCWGRPTVSIGRAAGWGLVGGFTALVSPVLGFVWGVLTLDQAARDRGSCLRFGWATLAVGLTLAPWTIRNYAVFGRFIPVKSNLAYELYQSQCLLPDGVLQGAGFVRHPYPATNPEGREYISLGETAFLNHKWEQFRESVRGNPTDFLQRLGQRFLAATLWYVPGELAGEAGQTWIVILVRCLHPLPLLALLIMVATRKWRPLGVEERIVMAAFTLYLLPYIVISYWERYSAPLLALKALLIVWAADRLLSIWKTRNAAQSGRSSAASQSAMALNR
jgi:hypothetical protein